MLESIFNFKENGTDLKTETMAGIFAFLSMAYVLCVNPRMLADGGMPLTGVFFAVALASGIACIAMGLIARYPIGLTPAMGLNAIFTYTIIISMQSSWEVALAATFISSMIFLMMTLSGLREAASNVIPKDLKLGIIAGIGFYLTLIGLKYSGIIVSDPEVLISIGPVASPPVLLALIGIFITLVFYVQKVPVAVSLGLAATAVIGFAFTLLGFGAGDGLMPHLPSHIISASFDTSLIFAFTRGFHALFSNIHNMIVMVFSLTLVTFFDATETLIEVGKESGFDAEKFQDRDIRKIFICDALGGVIASLCGSSTVTSHIESTAYIKVGARTGFAAVVTGVLFLLSVFFIPLIMSVFTRPVCSIALIIIGIIMISRIKDIDWDDLVIVASVFMTVLMTLLTYSICLGIAWGFVTYAVSIIASGEYRNANWRIWLLTIIFLTYMFFGV